MIKFKLEDAKEVAKKLLIDFKDFSIEDFLQGMNVEAEHGSKDKRTDIGADKPLIAGKIALSHLLESPNYYKELGRMEKKLERKNELNHPKVFYCRHIEKGVAQYDDGMYLVKDEALSKMKKSMAGVPVYVGHRKVDLENIKSDADGYVAECFYHELDGWYWAKFICVSDVAREAIARKWSVSNSYIATELLTQGVHHNINYDREVVDGYYTHLAIVPDPRYEGAFIVDEEEFKMYNKDILEKKELHNNKKTGGKMPFKFFKTKKEEVKEIDNDTIIELENGKQVKVSDMINQVVENEKEEKEEKEKMNMDGKVKVGEKEMTVKELVNKYLEATKDKKNESEESEEEKEKKNQEEKEKKEKEEEEKSNSKKKKEEEEKNKKNFINEIKNAIENGNEHETPKNDYEGMQDKIKRGKERY